MFIGAGLLGEGMLGADANSIESLNPGERSRMFYGSTGLAEIKSLTITGTSRSGTETKSVPGPALQPEPPVRTKVPYFT